jgi:hypothetical protein
MSLIQIMNKDSLMLFLIVDQVGYGYLVIVVLDVKNQKWVLIVLVVPVLLQMNNIVLFIV